MNNDRENLADYEWLTGVEGVSWLQEISHETLPLHRLTARLRKDLSAERVHLLLEQRELRSRAREKFSDANRMFFTSKGLQQATDQWIADYKAKRILSGKSVADLCCGIGGDLIALAAQCNEVLAVDLDPVAICLAEANLEAVAHKRSRTFQCCDVTKIDAQQLVVWHMDPDRQAQGRKTSQPEVGSPSLEMMEYLLNKAPDAFLKLSPAAKLPNQWEAACELEWISRGGECRQLVAWSGCLAAVPAKRKATVVRLSRDIGEQYSGPKSPNYTAHSICGEADIPVVIAPKLGRYLVEPDSAVLAAHLTGEFARLYQLESIAPGSVYLTSEEFHATELGSAYQVLDVFPFDRRKLTAYFKHHKVGTLEIKKRGVDIRPEELRRAFRLAGSEARTLVLARMDKRTLAIVCSPASDEKLS